MQYRTITLKPNHPIQQQLLEEAARFLSVAPLPSDAEAAVMGMLRKRTLVGFIEKYGSAILEFPQKLPQALLDFGLTAPQQRYFLLQVNQLDSLMATLVHPLFYKTLSDSEFQCDTPLASFGGWKLDARKHLIGVSRQVFHWLQWCPKSHPGYLETLIYTQSADYEGWLSLQRSELKEALPQAVPLLSFECVVDIDPAGNIQFKIQYVVAEELNMVIDLVDSMIDLPVSLLLEETKTYLTAVSDIEAFCHALKQQFFEYAYLDLAEFSKLRRLLQQFQQKDVTLATLVADLPVAATGRVLKSEARLEIETQLLKEKLKNTQAELTLAASHHIAEINLPCEVSPPGLLTQFSEAAQGMMGDVFGLLNTLLDPDQSWDWRP